MKLGEVRLGLLRETRAGRAAPPRVQSIQMNLTAGLGIVRMTPTRLTGRERVLRMVFEGPSDFALHSDVWMAALTFGRVVTFPRGCVLACRDSLSLPLLRR